MAKPIKSLELHYPMIQFLIILNIMAVSHKDWEPPDLSVWLVEIYIEGSLEFPI